MEPPPGFEPGTCSLREHKGAVAPCFFEWSQFTLSLDMSEISAPPPYTELTQVTLGFCEVGTQSGTQMLQHFESDFEVY